MSKKVICGIEFDTDKIDYSPENLRRNVTIASSKAFCAVRQVDRFSNAQLKILTNEVLRGRLNVNDSPEVLKVASFIEKIEKNGMSLTDIAILRSVYFSFEDILQFSHDKKTVDSILEEHSIVSPKIETIYGVTSTKLTEWFVPYKEAKGVAE